jgi:hypothetical protein
VARDVVRAQSAKPDTAEALAELRPELLDIDPVVVLFFCSANHDGLRIQTELKRLAPGAQVMGCTTSGEFTDMLMTGTPTPPDTKGGVVIVALSSAKVRRCATALAEYDRGASVEDAVKDATKRMAQSLAVDMRELDPQNWVGVVLNEGMNGNEEEVAAVLGHVAPFLSFVGGSAGDNLLIKECTVFCEGRKSSNGSALLLMELAVPYTILKTCSFEATETRVRIDRVKHRIVYEIDGQPALQRYAEIVGVKPEEVGNLVFMSNPLGLMIEGEPWVRSPVALLPDGGIMFGCRLIEGAEFHLLRSTELVGDTRRALAEGAERLGREPSIGLLFNCAHRCVEIQAKHIEDRFLAAISSFPVAGFHSYGESYLAQLNQTLIGLLLG